MKEHVIPNSKKFWNPSLEYAEEADFLNAAVFGCTAKEWQKTNPERNKSGENLRDYASINELNVLANAESKNAEMIREGLDKKTRFLKLQEMAAWQLKKLHEMDSVKSLKKLSPETYLLAKQKDEE